MGVEILIPIAAFGFFVMIVDQVRRLIGHWVLNGTIRRALEKDPASVPLLIDKLGSRDPMPIGLPGWVLLVTGVLVGVMNALAEQPDTEGWQAAAAAGLLGAMLIGFDLWNRRRSARALEDAAAPD